MKRVLKSGASLTYTVPDNASPVRLDKFLTQQFADYSRSFLQKIIKMGGIAVNDLAVSKSSHLLKPGDNIAINAPHSSDPDYQSSKESYEFGINILFTHEHFFVISKPAHLIVHSPSSFSTDPTVVDWILKNFKEIAQVGLIDRPGIVHRLDKQTSGVLIIPRTNYAHTYFGNLFRERTIHKTYYAVVQGRPNPIGTINTPIGRDPITKARMATFIPQRASHMQPLHMKEAVTHYKVIEYFQHSALLEIKPVTGRTHQIRVHCTSIGHPLIGDVLYGKKSTLIDRQALHAQSISFKFDGNDYLVHCDLPADFVQLINALRK